MEAFHEPLRAHPIHPRFHLRNFTAAINAVGGELGDDWKILSWFEL